MIKNAVQLFLYHQGCEMINRLDILLCFWLKTNKICGLTDHFVLSCFVCCKFSKNKVNLNVVR